MPPSNSHRRAHLLSLCALLAATTPSLHAATITMANNTDALNLTSSWIGGVVPTVADTALFDSTLTSSLTTTLGTDKNIGTIKVTNPAGPVTLNDDGHQLWVNVIDLSTATQNLTINNTVNLLGSSAWWIGSSRTLTLGNALYFPQSGFQLSLPSAGTASINGNVSGNGSITLSGASTLYLQGSANTYTGPTTINNAVLYVTSLANGGQPSSIGTSSSAASNLYGYGQLMFHGTIPTSTDRLFTLAGSFLIFNWNTTTSSTLSFSNPGPVAFAATGNCRLDLSGVLGYRIYNSFAPLLTDNTFGGQTSLFVSGFWTGLNPQNSFTGSLGISGVLKTSTLTNASQPSELGASSNNATNMFFSGGTLLLTPSAACSTDRLFGGRATLDSSGTAPVSFSNSGNIASSTTLTLTGSNSDQNIFTPKLSGSLSLIKSGSGTWVLLTTHTYTGTTKIAGGQLALDFSANDPSSILAASSPLNLSGGTLNLFGHPSTPHTQSFNTLTLSPGASAISLDPNGTASLTLTLSAISRGTTPGGTVDFNTLPGSTIATSTANTSGILGAWATAANHTSWATVNSGRIIPLATYTLNAFAPSANSDITSSLAASAATTNSLRFSASSTLTLDGLNTLASGGILVPSTSASVLITGGTLTPASGNDFYIHQYASSSVLTIASSLANNGTTSLTKAGPGTLVLAGINTYQGATTILQGTVRLDAPNALPVSPLTVYGTLDLQGQNVSPTAFLLYGALTNSVSSPSTLTVQSGSLYSSIAASPGTVSLVKQGPDTLTIYAPSFFTGDTVINGGLINFAPQYIARVTENVTDSNQISPSSRVVFNGGSLTMGLDPIEFRQTFNNALINAGDNYLKVGPLSASLVAGSRLQITNLQRNAGSTMNFNVGAVDPLHGIFIDALNGVPLPSTASGIIAGWAVVGTPSGPLEFATIAPGTINNLVGGATYSSTFSAASNTDVSGFVTAPLNATTGSLRFKGPNSGVTFQGTSIIASGGILMTWGATGSATIYGDNASLTSGTPELFFHQYNASLTLTAALPIVDNTSGSVSLVKSGPGTLTLSAISAYSGTTYINNGLLNLTANQPNLHAITGNGSLTIAAATAATAGPVALPLLTLNGTLNLRSNTGASKLSTLTLAGASNAWTAKVDLTNNPLILAASSSNKASTASTLLNQLKSGNNSNTWTGNGITSSTVAANPSQLTLALADNADLNLPSFAGQPLDANSLLIVPTQIGDANLDHTVDLADYDLWYTHVGSPGSATSRGDFNLDNTIDLADYDAWYTHVGASFPLTPQSSAFSTSSTPIPEPASLALLALTLPILTRRRPPART